MPTSKMRMDYVRRQLHSLTKGLLEAYPVRSSINDFFGLGVQFLHRTAMDYLGDPDRFETLRTRHHARFSLSHAFAWLRLAEYMCGIDRNINDLWFPHDFLVETIRCAEGELPVCVADKFRVAVTRRFTTSSPARSSTTPNTKIKYSVPLFFATHGNVDGASFHDYHVHGSWPHFAAAYAQTQYVLDLVSRQPEVALVDEGGEMSLVLSAMAGGDARLVRELVHRSGSLDDYIATRDRTHSRSRAPLWLLAVANYVWQLVQALASDSLKGPKTRSTMHALSEWIGYGANANLMVAVEEMEFLVTFPSPLEGGGGTSSGTHLQEDSDTDEEITAHTGKNDDNDDAGGNNSNDRRVKGGDEGFEFDAEAGESTGDTESDRSPSLSSWGRISRCPERKEPFRNYLCTVGRFLAICESRISDFDDRRATMRGVARR
ncbi:hypothetical protein QBC35DRAFT_184104 [Podospora australis]|uniref:DUF7791 domain-containing protein n=1 Tax=Podospora australis TaxID=1536484 RepID=A0AAN6WKX9_9PEZI|nr:hypothetical protein QBC35DRAFT_184104 [Podospora australis]